jgi:POT family proton-dependent oligopeptide transporter
MADTAKKKAPELFGHPLGLTYLFTTEMAERFSYYGMRAILVLYLTNFLLLHPTVDGVIGYSAIKRLLELIFNGGGTLSVQPLSSAIYGAYTALVYLTPFFGGIIADRWLGQRRSVLVGGVIMAAGEFILMLPQFMFLGLLCLIIGNGFFKPNISTQVGNLYKAGDSRIDRAFSIFYVGINVGAFFSPLICGSLGEDPAYGYHWGFFAAGVGMVIGQLIYIFALRTLPPDRISNLKSQVTVKKPLTANDVKSVIAIVLLCIPVTFFWATYEQQGNTINLWAQDFTNRHLIPGVVNWEIPVTWFQAFNPFMIFAFTPLVVSFWSMQSKRGREPSTVTKMAIGLALVAASYLVMAFAAHITGPHEQTSWLWLLVFFALITTGELYLSPIGLALVARVAPPQILSAMMGLWFITSFTGNMLQGYIGTFFEVLSKQNFFLLCAAIALAAGFVTWLFNFPLKPILDARMIENAPPRAEPEADPHMEPPVAL